MNAELRRASALLRLHLFDEPNERERDFVKRVNDSDLKGCRRLPAAHPQ
jgi:hypothetical protein